MQTLANTFNTNDQQMDIYTHMKKKTYDFHRKFPSTQEHMSRHWVEHRFRHFDRQGYKLLKHRNKNGNKSSSIF